MTTGTLAAARRLPSLRVSFFRVCVDGSRAVQIGGRDYNPEVTSIQYTTAVNVGFESATVAYDIQPYSASPAELLRHADLEQRDDMRPFVHVVITDNGEIVWEGRLSALYAPGGRFGKFDAVGYGKFAFQDYPIQWTNAVTSYTSGQVLRDAIHTAAPMVRIGAQNGGSPQTWAGGIQYVDPGVPHTQADIANVKYVDEILSQISKEGNLQGQAVWYGVFEHRTLSLLPVGVLPLDYTIDWDQAVDYKEDYANTYGAVLVTYSGGTKTSVLWPAGGQNADWVNEYGLSINGNPRTAHLNAGTLTDARALAYAQTQAGLFAQPTITAKVTVGGPASEGAIPGIRLATGGTRGPQLIRAGQTVQIGRGSGSKTVPIAKTTYTQDGNQVVNALDLGQPYPDIHAMVQALRSVAKHVAFGTNVNTGAPV